MTNTSGTTAAAHRALSRLEAACAELASLEAGITPEEWLHVRARIGKHLASYYRDVERIDDSVGLSSAQSRILAYLRLRCGEVVTKEEIAGVAGISAWARRVRELREDHGWVIHSAQTMASLRPGEYVLVSDERDPGLARAWTLAREKSRLKTLGGRAQAKARVLEFLKAVYPRPADMALLAHVADSPRAATAALDALERDGWKISRLNAAESIQGFEVVLQETQAPSTR